MNKQNKVISMIMVFGSIILSASNDGDKTPRNTSSSASSNDNQVPRTPQNQGSNLDSYQSPIPNPGAGSSGDQYISPLALGNTNDETTQDLPKTPINNKSRSVTTPRLEAKKSVSNETVRTLKLRLKGRYNVLWEQLKVTLIHSIPNIPEDIINEI